MAFFHSFSYGLNAASDVFPFFIALDTTFPATSPNLIAYLIPSKTKGFVNNSVVASSLFGDDYVEKTDIFAGNTELQTIFENTYANDAKTSELTSMTVPFSIFNSKLETTP